MATGGAMSVWGLGAASRGSRTAAIGSEALAEGDRSPDESVAASTGVYVAAAGAGTRGAVTPDTMADRGRRIGSQRL